MFINIYRLDTHFGGPEEGGWWYDSGEPVASLPLHDCFPYDAPVDPSDPRVEAVVEALRDLYPNDREYRRSLTRHASFSVVLEEGPAAEWPTEEPRYE